MTTAAIALVAALTAVAVAALLAAIGRRTRAASESRVGYALREMGERMDDLARELTASMERLREDSRRARAVEALGQTLDLDEVLARVTDAAAALPGAAASVVRVRPKDGEPLAASSGSTAPQPPPRRSQARRTGAACAPSRSRTTTRHARSPGDPLRSAIAVPLEIDAQELGFLAVYARGDDPGRPDDFGTLEAIAAHAGPRSKMPASTAKRSALRRLDALTGLANRSSFHDTLTQEVAGPAATSAAGAARSRRRRLQSVNERLGTSAAIRVLVEVAALVRESAAPPTSPCRIGGDEFAVILPEPGGSRRRACSRACRRRSAAASGAGAGPQRLGRHRRARSRTTTASRCSSAPTTRAAARQGRRQGDGRVDRSVGVSPVLERETPRTADYRAPGERPRPERYASSVASGGASSTGQLLLEARARAR